MDTCATRRLVHKTLVLAAVSVVGLLAPSLALSQSVGDKAEFTDLTTFDGSTVKANDLKGRPVLLYFWASWCPTCMNEMPYLKKMHTKYRDKGFEILAISIREEPQKSLAFFKRNEFEFPGGPIDAAYQATYPNLRRTPTWYLVDRAGIIRTKFSGTQDVRWELEKALTPLL